MLSVHGTMCNVQLNIEIIVFYKNWMSVGLIISSMFLTNSVYRFTGLILSTVKKKKKTGLETEEAKL